MPGRFPHCWDQNRLRFFGNSIRRWQVMWGTISVLILLWGGEWRSISGQTKSPSPQPFASAFASTPEQNSSGLNSSPATLNKRYLKGPQISLPIVVDDRIRSQIKEFRLFRKNSQKSEWILQDRAFPSQKEFLFRALRDGEYWFTLVTVDLFGRPSTTDLDAQPPHAVVVVDQTPPEINVQLFPPTKEGQCFHCDIDEENLDATQTTYEYQTRELNWGTAKPLAGRKNVFCVPRQANHNGLIRVTAVDRSGNRTVRQMPIEDLQASFATTNQDSTNPRIPEVSASQGKSSSSQNIDAPSHSARNSNPFSPGKLLPQEFQNQAEAQYLVKKSAVKQSPTALKPTSYQAKTPAPLPFPPIRSAKMVNNPRVILNYQVEGKGASGVGKVEVWLTPDQGQSWQPLVEDKDKTSPVEIHLHGEGLFGLSLVATNGRGFGGQPPVSGDAPDWYIEVDRTPPQVHLHSVKPIQPNQPGLILISWSARDKNLAEEPIDLYYSNNAEGSWIPIAKGLRNEGQYRWLVPQKAGGHVHVRIVVTDLAGNISHAQTQQPVAIDDLSRPRIRVTGIETVPVPNNP